MGDAVNPATSAASVSLFNLSAPPVYKLEANTRFDVWEMRLKASFQMRGVESTLQPSNNATPEQEAYAKSLLCMNVADENLSLVSNAASVSDAMSKLRAKYTGRVTARFLTLSHALHTIQKLPNESIEQYVERAVQLQSDLQTVKQPVTDSSVCAALLRGLPSEYKLVKEMISESVKDADDFSIVELRTSLMRVEQDVQNEDTALTSDTAKALMAAGRMRRQSGQKRGTRPDHVDEGKRPTTADNNSKRRKFPGVCYNCGRPGHMMKDCQKPVQPHLAAAGRAHMAIVHSTGAPKLPDGQAFMASGGQPLTGHTFYSVL
jgi:gag-polypeptide of LTR copia-type/Zinc knuckle